MLLHVWHSHQQRCGVREYGLGLDRSLENVGVKVKARAYTPDFSGAGDALPQGSNLLVHFEPSLIHPNILAPELFAARAKGAKIVFCCHWYDHGHLLQWDKLGLFDRVVMHRTYEPMHQPPVGVIVPLGCPVYQPAEPRETMRARLGLPTGKIILTTIGFLTWWKCFPDVTRAMLDAIGSHPDLFLHVHTPWPFDDAGARQEEPQMRALAANHPQRLKFSTEFLAEKDVLDIARASDLGFFYHPIHTGSASAATKQFVSARRPMVLTDSTHTRDVSRGNVRRVADFNPNAFARAVVETAVGGSLPGMQTAAEPVYDEMNMDAVASKYARLFKEL